ncbi:MAG: hypothetical protein A2086_12235 [Spirochaetes bacterium GWD1_27_9]|nr:MAG: hypothetical protein A2Z98_06665 [Spirochaetes bacterium GWB1_27_13]OHD26195.1 MAG: hypothetical protein A2Y34_09595 [Spirochaetes bacterium GWC1_27_15]OHD35748.1 MAG: hypothetical protein A2086_12235 [Spirochaetes bacterium GWD1_27_9]
MKKIIVLFVVIYIALLLTGCKNTKESKINLTNKEKVVALITSLETGDHTPISYINPKKYIQHNLMAGDGLEGFGELMKHKPPQGFKAKVVRAFEDGDFVFTHTEYDFFGPKIGFDIFRFENGLIVEHWDNLQETVTKTKSGHSMTDGTTEVIDVTKTAENKQFIKNFFDDILYSHKMEKITNYISTEKYIQHNPGVGDGLQGFGDAMAELAKAGLKMEYKKTYLILGEGEFVFTQSEGEFAGKNVTFYDLFRIENAKITEHWDVIEETIAKEQWKNQNGKF